MNFKFLFLLIVLVCLTGRSEAFQVPANGGVEHVRYDSMPDVMPGTKPLTWDTHLSDTMMYGAHRLIDGKIRASVAGRSKMWNRNFRSHKAYEESVEPNRRRFMKYIGVEDKSEPDINYNAGLEDKHPPVLMQKFSNASDPVLIAETPVYRIYQVRWTVLNKVNGEGLLLEPKTKPVANIIALPDADQTPEQLVGLAPGIPAESQFARNLAENGFQVLIPVLVNRAPLFPGKRHEQTTREWIYRQAFHMGRHLIGYEVQKVMAAVDWFKQSSGEDVKIGVAGYGEGGLIAFYSAAVDKRVDAVLVSGYFESRQQVWDEPIYRNVWGLLTEFGDAEIASLIAPRPLVIEHSFLPDTLVHTMDRPSPMEMAAYTGYKGSLQTPRYRDVQSEFNRIDSVLEPGFQPRFLIKGQGNNPTHFGSEPAIRKFTQLLGYDSLKSLSENIPVDSRNSFDSGERQVRQAKEMENHVQWLMHVSDYERNAFFLHKIMPEFGERRWSTKSYHPYYSPDRFIHPSKKYRRYFREKILGSFDEELLPPNARTRKIYEKKRWNGFEVVLDVYSGFIAPGVILIPRDIKPGEKRPVVVVQHGRNGVPQDIIEGNNTAYNNTASKLADRGFIVYAPYGLYRGEDRYRWLDRKANAVKKTLFSFIVSQHEQLLQWLGNLPFVDNQKIAFYGLSYGGEVAMRIPAVLEGYSLSICSGDFGNWTRKVVDTHFPNSFMNTIEWEMPYFNMGSTFSYAEMAYLIFPRPFMVERGHDDLVQPDEWVAYEYGKVNYLYNQFNLGDKTEIEYFNGGHSMRGDGTFQFLHKHLEWP